MKIDASTPALVANTFAQAVILQARVLGMQAENQDRVANGQAIAYRQDSFECAISDFWDQVRVAEERGEHHVR